LQCVAVCFWLLVMLQSELNAVLTFEIWESQPFIEILKSQLYSNFIEVIELRADFWEFVSGWKCARERHIVAGWRMVAGKQVQILCVAALLQRVAACCSVLQRVACAACFIVCCSCSVWKRHLVSDKCLVAGKQVQILCVAACRSVLQRVAAFAACCSVL